MIQKLFILFVVLFSATTLVAGAAPAESINTNLPGTDPGSGNIAQYVVNAYRFALLVGGLLAFGVIVFGAVKYAASGGNSNMQSDAKSWITDAILGLILLAGATVLLTFINPDLAKLKATPPLTRLAKPDEFSLATPGGGGPVYGCKTDDGVTLCSGFKSCNDLPQCTQSGSCEQIENRAHCGLDEEGIRKLNASSSPASPPASPLPPGVPRKMDAR